MTNLMRNGRTRSQHLACWFKNGLGGAGLAGLIGRLEPMMNLTKNTELAHSAWCVGSKMSWRGRIGRLDLAGGLYDEYDEK